MTAWWRRHRSVDAVVLLAVAVALRAPGFDAHRLFLDDAAVAVVRRADSLRDVLRVGVTAPGFAVVEKAMIGLFGYSVSTLKVVPFVAGVLAPIAVYLTARRLSFGRLAALGAGALLATSPVQTAMSGHVKQYSLDVVLACALVVVGWPLASEAVQSRRRATVFALAATAGTLFSAALAAVVAGVYAGAAVAMVRRRRFDAVVLAGGAVWAAVFALWTAAVLSDHTNELLRQHWHAYFVPTDEGVVEAVRVAGVRLVGAVAGLTRAYVFAVPAALLGAILLVRERLELAVVLLTPLAIGLALAIAHVAPFGGGGAEGRIDSFAYLSLAVLVVAGLQLGWHHMRLPARVLTAGVVVLALVRLPVDVRYPNQDPTPLVRTLASTRRPGDAVFVHPLASFHAATDGPWPVDIRAASGSTTNFWPWIDAPGFHMPAVCCDDPRDLEPAIARASRATRVWVLALFDDRAGVVARFEARGYDVRRRWRAPGATLDLLERP